MLQIIAFALTFLVNICKCCRCSHEGDKALKQWSLCPGWQATNSNTNDLEKTWNNITHQRDQTKATIIKMLCHKFKYVSMQKHKCAQHLINNNHAH